MKVTMYGTEICGDCITAKQQLKGNPNIELDYKNITENTSILKEFLAFRDKNEMFTTIKEKGNIGIPFFILEDGTETFDILEFVDNNISDEKLVSACSIDGKGQC